MAIRRRRAALAVVAALALLYAVLALVVPAIVNADRFRPAIETRLSSALGRPVRLGALRLRLWTGVAVRADRLEIGPEPGSGGASGSLEARDVTVRPALLALVPGRRRRNLCQGGRAGARNRSSRPEEKPPVQKRILA